MKKTLLSIIILGSFAFSAENEEFAKIGCSFVNGDTSGKSGYSCPLEAKNKKFDEQEDLSQFVLEKKCTSNKSKC